jgi:hypothetical protein
MSEHTQEHTGRRNRKEPAQVEATQANGEDTNGAIENASGEGSSGRTVTIEMTVSDNKEAPKLQVTVPLKFRLGHVLTDNQAKVLDTAYQRQFINNMNANLKARRERLEKATTAAERNENALLTAGEIAALYTDYEPNVGGGPRMSTLERMRHDAAWRAWVGIVTEHNNAIMAGGEPVIAALGKRSYKPEAIPTAKRKDETKEEFEARKEAATDRRLTHTTKMLDMPKYAERIQIELDKILAEKGQDKAEGEEAVNVSVDELL